MSWFRWLCAVFLCIAIFASLGFIKFNQVMAAIAFGESFPEPSETVYTQKVTLSQWRAETLLSGETSAPQMLTLTNQQAGLITYVNGEAGQLVNAGDVFINIDISEETAQLTAMQAQVALAQLDVDRLAKLIKVNASSTDQYDRALAQLDVVKAQVQAIEANIAKKQVKFPFSGRLGLHSLEVGQYINANTPLTSLVGSLDPIWVEVGVPEALAFMDTQAPLTVYHQNTQYTGNIIAKASSINTINRALPIRIAIANPHGKLSPGSFVQVAIPDTKSQSVYEIADTAVRYSALGSYVYALEMDENGQYRAQRQEVSILHKHQNTVIVAADFPSDTLIATLGAFKLREGMWVKVAEQQP